MPKFPPADRRPVARHGRLPTRHPLTSILQILSGLLSVVVISAACIASIAGAQLLTATAPSVHLAHLKGDVVPPSIDAITGGVNLLIVGTDTRTGQAGFQADVNASTGAGNNDVTILVHIAHDHQSMLIVSFPRDMLIPVPACPNGGSGKYSAVNSAMLNTTLARGGLSCPVLTIEKLTGISIPYAAVVSFDGVVAMSNAVGGVPVCVATPINDPYSGLVLPAGESTIQGAQALAFLRSRHGVGDGSDLGRISNQQSFLSSLARTVKGNGVVSDPLKLYALARAAVTNMQLSDTLNHLDTMVAIGLAVKSIPLPNIAMIQYPVAPSPADPNRVVPSQAADDAVNAALVNDQRVQLTGTTGRGAQIAPSPTPVPTNPPAPPATNQPTSPVQALPTAVQGQSADQQTCSKGNIVKQ